MKKTLTLLVAISLMACTNRPNNETNSSAKDTVATAKPAEPVLDLTIPALPTDYVKTNLSKMGLKATMMTVKNVDMQASELDDNQGARPEYLVNAFKMPSGDEEHDKTFGGTTATIEMYTTKWTLKQHLDYVKSSVISGFKRVLKQENDFVLFTTSPQNTSQQPIRAKDKEVFHFILMVKNEKTNTSYCVRNSSSVDLSLADMLQLLSIAKTIEWQ